MTFKAINDITRLNNIVLTLLVYNTLPRIVKYDAPLPTITQRLTALKKAMAEIQKL
jgi:hypothetical protein